jgi:tetratricopeptide (TPR) repeat protein
MFDVMAGELALQRGQVGAAAQVLARAALATRDPRLVERATLAAFHARQFEDALLTAELWVELRPGDVEAREALATVMLELGRAAEAQLQLEQVLALERARAQLDQGFLRVATVLGRYSNRITATELMQTLVQRYPESAAAHLYAGHLAVRAGEFDSAAALADAALQLQPAWQDAAVFRARIFISQKDVTGAHRFYEAFLREHSGATAVRLNFARFLIDQKQWEKALVEFKRLLAETPDDADATYAAALLALQTNHPAEAARYLRRTLELRPDNDQARIYLGQAAEQEKRYDDALRWYREIDSGDTYFEAQTRIAMVLARQGDVDAARRQLQAIQPEGDEQHVQRALAEEQILRDARRHREALDVLNQAIEAVPGDKELLYARALIAERLDMLDVAENDLRTILLRDPKNANALNALGYTLADRTTRYQEAYELLKEALALKPDDPFILDSFGWVNYRLGNYADSVRLLKRALELRNDAEIAAHLGEVLWVSGQPLEAESVWNSALRIAPDNETLLDVMKKFQR